MSAPRLVWPAKLRWPRPLLLLMAQLAGPAFRAEDVVRALEQVSPRIGYPKMIRVDQGSELVSRDLDL